MKELTLYDIMGEDHYIIAKVEKGQVNTEVLDENDEQVFNETSHHYAWDSLVSFAKMVLEQDKHVQKQLAEGL
jgi:hypothetical protein